jgi:hypothetical protein
MTVDGAPHPVANQERALMEAGEETPLASPVRDLMEAGEEIPLASPVRDHPAAGVESPLASLARALLMTVMTGLDLTMMIGLDLQAASPARALPASLAREDGAPEDGAEMTMMAAVVAPVESLERDPVESPERAPLTMVHGVTTALMMPLMMAPGAMIPPHLASQERGLLAAHLASQERALMAAGEETLLASPVRDHPAAGVETPLASPVRDLMEAGVDGANSEAPANLTDGVHGVDTGRPSPSMMTMTPAHARAAASLARAPRDLGVDQASPERAPVESPERAPLTMAHGVTTALMMPLMMAPGATIPPHLASQERGLLAAHLASQERDLQAAGVAHLASREKAQMDQVGPAMATSTTKLLKYFPQ